MKKYVDLDMLLEKFTEKMEKETKGDISYVYKNLYDSIEETVIAQDMMSNEEFSRTVLFVIAEIESKLKEATNKVFEDFMKIEMEK